MPPESEYNKLISLPGLKAAKATKARVNAVLQNVNNV